MMGGKLHTNVQITEKKKKKKSYSSYDYNNSLYNASIMYLQACQKHERTFYILKLIEMVPVVFNRQKKESGKEALPTTEKHSS